MAFDKLELARLLNIAKGDRSINKWGVQAGVDPGYLSRLLRGLIDSPPSAAILKKLADTAWNNITVHHFMAAAGYLDKTAVPYPDPPPTPGYEPEWAKVIEEAAKYDIPPEAAAELIRSVGKSMQKLNKRSE